MSDNPLIDASEHINHLDGLDEYEPQHYCVINQKEYNESEMIFVASQGEWVCVDTVNDYLHWHYVWADLQQFNKIKHEVENLIK